MDILMNWAKNHLNWTAVISFFAIGVFLIVLMGFIINPIMGIRFPLPEDQLWKISVSLLSMVVILFALLTLISAWVLKRKNRSLWWLLVLFVPPFWGFFGLILLKNKSRIPPQPEGIFIQHQV
jgi:hypothetical protein